MIEGPQDIGDFMTDCDRSRTRHERAGQAAFNTLYTGWPEVADEIRGNPNLDPFYNDDLLPAFYEWVEERLFS